MGSQQDFGEHRDALQHFPPTSPTQLHPKLLSPEGREGVTTPSPLILGSASVLPHCMGKKKSTCGSIFRVFLLKYCYTKWNATAILV